MMWELKGVPQAWENVGVNVMRFVLSEEAARVALLGVDV